MTLTWFNGSVVAGAVTGGAAVQGGRGVDLRGACRAGPGGRRLSAIL